MDEDKSKEQTTNKKGRARDTCHTESATDSSQPGRGLAAVGTDGQEGATRGGGVTIATATVTATETTTPTAENLNNYKRQQKGETLEAQRSLSKQHPGSLR